VSEFSDINYWKTNYVPEDIELSDDDMSDIGTRRISMGLAAGSDIGDVREELAARANDTKEDDWVVVDHPMTPISPVASPAVAAAAAPVTPACIHADSPKLSAEQIKARQDAEYRRVTRQAILRRVVHKTLGNNVGVAPALSDSKATPSRKQATMASDVSKIASQMAATGGSATLAISRTAGSSMTIDASVAKDIAADLEDLDSEESDDDFDMGFSDDDDDDEDIAALLAKKKAEASKDKKPVKQGKSQIIFDVKPMGLETDMDELEEHVRQISLESLKWCGAELVDVAFGIKKLRIICTLVDDLVPVDDIEDAINDIEDVQSLEIFAFNKL
jgi:elongation factor 1-beta